MLGLSLAARSLTGSSKRPVPIYDEVSYLDAARIFSDEGGSLKIIAKYFQGEIKEDKWNPLYLMILSKFMDRTPFDFARAKLLSLATCLLLLLVVFALVLKQWGYPAALLSAAFVAFSPMTVFLSHQVLADILFSLFYFMAIMVLIREELTLRTSCVLGLLVGLAFLTKGNGHFLFFSIAAVGVAKNGLSFFRKPFLYVCLVVFALGASFLLTRNIAVYGRPFYHLAGKAFWLDSWPDIFIWPDYEDWNHIGLGWYLQHHTWLEFTLRFWNGMQTMILTLMRSLSVGSPALGTTLLTGGFILGLALYGVVLLGRQRRRTAVVGILTTPLVLIVAFAWGAPGMNAQWTTHWRYTYPFALTLFPLAVICLQHFFDNKNGILLRYRLKILESAVLAVAFIFIFQNRGAFARNPMSLWEVNPVLGNTSQWIKTNIPNERFLIDNFSRFSPWDCCRDNRDLYPMSAAPHLIENHLVKNGIHFIVIDQLLKNADPFSEKYGPSDAYGPTSFMNRTRCHHDENKPSLLLIYSDACPDAS